MQYVSQSLTFDLLPVDGLMSYSIPEGQEMIYRGLDVYFNDSVYDGASAERSGFFLPRSLYMSQCSCLLTLV